MLPLDTSFRSAFVRDLFLAYSRLQNKELEEQEYGFRAVKHQSFVGTGFFDQVTMALTGGDTTTTAMDGSTEEAQF